MNKVIKEIAILSIIGITLIFMLSSNDSNFKVPNSEEISSIILVDVIGNKGIKKTIIYQKSDISNMLDILSNSQRTSKKSISQLPNKTKFTIVLFKFESGDTSWRSIYEEEGNLHIDQPFDGIFKLDSNNLYTLDEIIKKGSNEEISIRVENIGSVIKSVH